MIHLRDIMSKDLIVCSPNDRVIDAVKLMVKDKISSVIIEDEGKDVGILTEKDLVKRILAKQKDPHTTLVKTIMTKRIITADVESSVLAISKKMELHHLKRIPITENDKIVGIITSRDIIRLMAGVN
jgi:CBS domain-containing protein